MDKILYKAIEDGEFNKIKLLLKLGASTMIDIDDRFHLIRVTLQYFKTISKDERYDEILALLDGNDG